MNESTIIFHDCYSQHGNRGSRVAQSRSWLYVSRMTEWLCFNITSFNRIQFGLTIYNEANIIQSMDSMQKYPVVALSASKCNKSNNVENLVGCKPSRLWFSQHGITFTSKKRGWMHRIFYSGMISSRFAPWSIVFWLFS